MTLTGSNGVGARDSEGEEDGIAVGVAVGSGVGLVVGVKVGSGVEGMLLKVGEVVGASSMAA